MVLWIIVAVVLVIIFYGIGVNNRLVRLRNQGEEAEAAVDAHLKQRYDLVPNLVETVKGYAKHEQGTLTAVIQARNAAMSAQGLEARDSADKAFTSTLKSLFALAESYPDLKANTGFIKLQDQLTRIEGELLNARKYYNAIVKQFNTVVEVFPSSIIASIGRFLKKPYLTIEAEARERVEVKF